MVHLQLTDAEGRCRRLPAQKAFEVDFIEAVLKGLPWWVRRLAEAHVTHAIEQVIAEAKEVARPRVGA